MTMLSSAGSVVSTILKHDNKQTSYKIALIRALNDVVLSFPDLHVGGHDVAVPLRVLAEFWVAYYWPFVDPGAPILQGPRANRAGGLANDMAFRSELMLFRELWQEQWSGSSMAGDGFYVINELRVPRRRSLYPIQLLQAYDTALKKIARTIEMPIRYAGPGEWSVFGKPQRFDRLFGAVPVPGTQPNDVCLLVSSELWRTFRELSLWVEALCIHEWCLFTERVHQNDGHSIERGLVYSLLTARPDNRRPLTWERNQVDILLMEGREFICPWTEKRISRPGQYDLDHLVPIAVYPINELWNLVPSDSHFNSYTKRDKLPSDDHLVHARPHLERAYRNYEASVTLSRAIHEDVEVRFSTGSHQQPFSQMVAGLVVDFVGAVAEARNISRF